MKCTATGGGNRTSFVHIALSVSSTTRTAQKNPISNMSQDRPLQQHQGEVLAALSHPSNRLTSIATIPALSDDTLAAIINKHYQANPTTARPYIQYASTNSAAPFSNTRLRPSLDWAHRLGMSMSGIHLLERIQRLRTVTAPPQSTEELQSPRGLKRKLDVGLPSFNGAADSRRRKMVDGGEAVARDAAEHEEEENDENAPPDAAGRRIFSDITNASILEGSRPVAVQDGDPNGHVAMEAMDVVEPTTAVTGEIEVVEKSVLVSGVGQETDVEHMEAVHETVPRNAMDAVEHSSQKETDAAATSELTSLPTHHEGDPSLSSHHEVDETRIAVESSEAHLSTIAQIACTLPTQQSSDPLSLFFHAQQPSFAFDDDEPDAADTSLHTLTEPASTLADEDDTDDDTLPLSQAESEFLEGSQDLSGDVDDDFWPPMRQEDDDGEDKRDDDAQLGTQGDAMNADDQVRENPFATASKNAPEWESETIKLPEDDPANDSDATQMYTETQDHGSHDFARGLSHLAAGTSMQLTRMSLLPPSPAVATDATTFEDMLDRGGDDGAAMGRDGENVSGKGDVDTSAIRDGVIGLQSQEMEREEGMDQTGSLEATEKATGHVEAKQRDEEREVSHQQPEAEPLHVDRMPRGHLQETIVEEPHVDAQQQPMEEPMREHAQDESMHVDEKVQELHVHAQAHQPPGEEPRADTHQLPEEISIHESVQGKEHASVEQSHEHEQMMADEGGDVRSQPQQQGEEEPMRMEEQMEAQEPMREVEPEQKVMEGQQVQQPQLQEATHVAEQLGAHGPMRGEETPQKAGGPICAEEEGHKVVEDEDVHNKPEDDLQEPMRVEQQEQSKGEGQNKQPLNEPQEQTHEPMHEEQHERAQGMEMELEAETDMDKEEKPQNEPQEPSEVPMHEQAHEATPLDEPQQLPVLLQHPEPEQDEPKHIPTKELSQQAEETVLGQPPHDPESKPEAKSPQDPQHQSPPPAESQDPKHDQQSETTTKSTPSLRSPSTSISPISPVGFTFGLNVGFGFGLEPRAPPPE
ncbi:uncharacterized protein EV422DRAFT_49204 [Fimicolochytrium jonesii]|uniref:uncharacterized protein n=1 Tax=Fimicolochytrium jonesii TaxID=1396493 RepID=UPI0022FF44F9|nr:uncharacterized protein EV422DRAFT_49204 [Fimicolochytrium jonesii]KAI8821008.1 hypothetical protein EV422DRAFT_49204 [Fimicolochytrium jonesii]